MMKKITLLMLALMGLSLNAQVYFEEDFEAQTVDAPPANFTVLNEDACTVNTPTGFPNESWMVSDNGDAQGQFAAAQSWTNPAACTVDDWLITSAIDLSTATANTSLKWKGISFEGPSYPETYEVRLSTTGTAVGDFTVLLTTITNELEIWTDHTLSLAAYTGNNVYLAFRLISTDQSQCWIDDIKVSEPAPYDMAITSVNSAGIKQTSAFSSGAFLVLDYSKRTNFTSEVVLKNVGLNAVDSVYLTYFLVDDVNAPTEGEAFGDVVYVAGGIAPGASYTHTFPAFSLDTLFPSLATDQVLDFYVQVDSSFWNQESDVLDFNYQILVAPTESYSAPYSTSFEVADLNAGVFLFDHSTWGWKYLDNDQDNVSLSVGNDFSNLPAQDGSMQVYGSLNGNSLSQSADDDRMESPELTLTGGSAYSFSIWARTAFGITGSIACQLTSAAGAYTNTIGTITLAPGDSTYSKYSFSILAPSTQTDFKIRYNKTTTGFVCLDLFELSELQMPTGNISLNASSTDAPGVEYCDSTVTVNFSATGNPSSLSLNWGDGTAAQNVTGLTTASHTYGAFGSYSIVLSATNLVGTGTANVALSFTALPAPTVTFGAPLINGNTVTVSIGASVGTNVVYTPACSRVIIDWGDGVIDEVTGSASTNHTYASSGSFTVTVTVIGSTTTSATQSIVITGISNINFVNALNIFPNPANDFVNVSFGLASSEDIELTVYSVDGKVIETRAFANESKVNTTFNTSSLNNGVYILKINTENGISTQKFVVSHN
jgi:hypothetical protein